MYQWFILYSIMAHKSNCPHPAQAPGLITRREEVALQTRVKGHGRRPLQRGGDAVAWRVRVPVELVLVVCGWYNAARECPLAVLLPNQICAQCFGKGGRERFRSPVAQEH
jgi:hypothetical protein